MTVRLYYEDPYLLTFTAEVKRREAGPDGIRVYLDRTAFYPESGGQPADHGRLDQKEVLDVQEDAQGEIFHLLAEAPGSQEVTGEVDFGRRFDHMQQHTGQHILSAVFLKLFGWQTLSFHLGQDTSTIDMDTDRVDAQDAAAALAEANRIIWKNLPVEIGFYTDEDISDLSLRKPTERSGEIRVIGIEGVDRSACGGTHVRHTGEVGVIFSPRLERMRGRLRVHFVCGRRAYEVLCREHEVLMQLVEMTTTGYEELPAKLERQAGVLRQLEKEQLRLKMQLWELSLPELYRKGEPVHGMTVVVEKLDEAAEAARFISQKLVAAYPATVGVIASAGDGALLVARSRDLSLDLTRLIADLRRSGEVRGGGRPDQVQIGGLDDHTLPRMIRQVMEWLERIPSGGES
jgi:alanyl-tRNA synthetase